MLKPKTKFQKPHLNICAFFFFFLVFKYIFSGQTQSRKNNRYIGIMSAKMIQLQVWKMSCYFAVKNDFKMNIWLNFQTNRQTHAHTKTKTQMKW